MARLNIDTGILGNPATGDTLRTAFGKINDNFIEVFDDLSESGLGGRLTNETTNGDVVIQPNGTGIVEVDQLQITDDAITSLVTNSDLTLSGNGTGNVHINDGSLIVGVNDANAVITTLGTGDLTLSTNGGTNSGTIEIKDGANGDITIENDGTGDILLKAGGQVGIGSVSSPDTSLHVKTAAAKVTLQRTADANTPGISFQQSGGNVRAELMMDGTSGTSNTVFVKTHDGASLAERFRVTHTGAKVTGTLDVDGGISVTDNKITASRSNDNLEISASGTGSVKTDSNLHLHSATPIIQIQRSDNANVPGISFLGDGGTEGGSIKFDGTSGTTNEIILSSFHSSAVTERLRVQTTGAKVTGILKIGDGSATDNYAGFGNADDLKIFHNGSHSIIRETGTGSLYLQSDNNVIIGKDSGSDTMIKGVADGAVELYHDNSKKFETTSGGVSVTGNLAADGSQIDFTSLPTSDPGVAGRLFRSGNDVKISTG